jgi:uncharacterized protein (TIGR03435 family)
MTVQERFQLKVHKESRELPIYALTVGKGGLKIAGTPVDPDAPPPKVFEAAGSGSADGVVINMGAGTLTTVSPMGLCWLPGWTNVEPSLTVSPAPSGRGGR